MKPTRKCERSDAMVFKSEADMYAKVLRDIRGEKRLSPQGADVKTIQRTRVGEMILVLKKNVVKNGTSYKAQAQKVLGEKVQVRALTVEAV